MDVSSTRGCEQQELYICPERGMAPKEKSCSWEAAKDGWIPCDTSPPICVFSETENGDDYVVIVDDDGDEEDEEDEEATDVHEIVDEEESGQGEGVEEVLSSPEDNITGPTTCDREQPDGKDSEAEEDG
ncbi:hypothetical protein JRQ81_003617 [Phrynocephalus forsythii]|uniref:Uncharacterized protein n=1 Tax=Phrynocephalus forsythii TaxID=171643 RepID=A0A9Q0XM23_9SAUR|nr:hypothetical protein JRQ81_003617 [Phrynocephalus forsythii]